MAWLVIRANRAVGGWLGGVAMGGCLVEEELQEVGLSVGGRSSRRF